MGSIGRVSLWLLHGLVPRDGIYGAFFLEFVGGFQVVPANHGQ